VKTLRITSTVTVVTNVPYNEHHYGKMTIEQAVEAERDTDPKVVWEAIQMAVQSGECEGSQQRNVDVIDEDNSDGAARFALSDIARSLQA